MSNYAPPGFPPGTYWVDLPPVSPHANDDEFNDASLGGAWTEWDPGSKVTVTETAYGLQLVNSQSASDSWGGVYRSLPAGDWSITTKMSWVANRASYPTSGISLLQDPGGNPTTTDFAVWALGSETSQVKLRYLTYSSYTTNSSAPYDEAWVATHAYLRIRRISTTNYFDISADGIGWQGSTNVTDATLGYTPNAVGLICDFGATAYYRFWRQSSTTTLDQPLLGRVF